MEIQTQKTFRRSTQMQTKLNGRISVAVETEETLYAEKAISASMVATKHLNVAVTVEGALYAFEILSASAVAMQPEKHLTNTLMEELNPEERVEA